MMPTSLVVLWQDIWNCREFLSFFALRDINARYRRSWPGFLWILAQPCVLAFTVAMAFDQSVVSVLTAILPWQFFVSVIHGMPRLYSANQDILKKEPLPTVFLPTSAVLVAFTDFALGLMVLFFVGLAYRLPVTAAILTLPLFLLLAALAALSIGIWFTSLPARHAQSFPFLLVLSFLLSPIAYFVANLPPVFGWLVWLNPLSGIIEGMRWAILGSGEPPLVGIAVCFVVSTGLLISAAANSLQASRVT